MTTVDKKDFIYKQCNKNKWFTCGTARQYEGLFDMIGENASLAEISNYISSHSYKVSADDVYEVLDEELRQMNDNY